MEHTASLQRCHGCGPPTLARSPFHREGYVYEEKYDGWRMVALKDGPRVHLVSRRGIDHTARFSNLASSGRRRAR